jgi:hypothetical protein
MRWETICTVVMLSLCLFAQQLPGPPPHRPSTAATEAFIISGMVVDMVSGEPLPKAEVSIALTAGPGVFRDEVFVESGPDGRFAFSNVKKGKYMLSASKRGYSLQSFEAHDEFSTAIVTGPGLDSEHLLFRMRPSGSVHGHVTDDQNDPVPNATIYLAVVDSRTGQRTMRLARTAQTDDRGEFTIRHLPPAKYFLAVVARPWYAVAQRTPVLPDSANERGASLDVAFPVTYYPGTTDSSAARPLKVQPGERVSADFVLNAVPALRLQASREPEDSATVSEQSAPTSLRRYSQPRSFQIRQRLFGTVELPVSVMMDSQPDGTLEATGLAPGQYEVLSGPQDNPKVKRVDLRSTTSLDSAENTRRTAVRGTVAFDQNVPKGRTTVVLYSRTTGNQYFALVDEKNEFKITEPVVPTTYEVIVNSRMNSYLKELSAKGARSSGHNVTIGGSAEAELKVSVSYGTGEVNGIALLSNRPCAAAMIVLIPEDSTNNIALFRRDQSDSDGTFTLPNAVPGRYVVLALGGAWELEWLNADVLRRYMKGGTAVTVEAGSRNSVTVQVQNAN